MSEPSKQLAPVEVPLDQPLATLEQAKQLARDIALSALVPDSMRGKPQDVIAIVLYGRELNMSPMQSLQAIYSVRSKPQLSADGWQALARRQGHRIKWGHRDNTSATVTITRGDTGEEHTETFTIDDALRAKLIQKINPDGTVVGRGKSGEATPWELYTKRMLSARALSFCAKAICPDVALGFGVAETEYDYAAGDPPERPVAASNPHVKTLNPEEVAAQVRAAEAAFVRAQDQVEDAEVVPESDDPDGDAVAAAFEREQGKNGAMF